MKTFPRLLRYLSVAWLLLAAIRLTAADFIHPGLLHSQQDLDRLKTAVATQSGPAFAGWPAFRDHNRSASTYVMQGPFAEFGRPTPNIGSMDNDCNAAYQNAVMWYVTGNSAHAAKSIQILNAWSATLTTISGADAVLAAGLDGFKLINAAEILRYSNSGWAPADIVRFEQWLKAVWYPVLEPFALYANGNWDGAAMKTIIAIGVFCNDRALYERAVRFYLDGPGNGRLTYYVVNEDGQAQESGRDQPHTMLGIGLLAEIAEVAWNQGSDLYGAANNRLLKGFEYTARYNMLQGVPYTPYLDRSGKYGAGGSVENYSIISDDGRGQYRPVFEMAWNHYVNRTGQPAPFTKQYADLNRPEGAGQTADHPGFGTFLFSRDPVPPSAPAAAPAVPAGVFAHATATGNVVSWPASLRATSYSVKRATGAGPFSTIAAGLTDSTFTDSIATTGELYRYVVSAANAIGTSDDSTPVAVTATGLPAPWSHQDVGAVTVTGSADHDGQVFTLEAAGTDIGGASDSFRFAFVPLTGNGTITARLIGPLSSQRAKVGVMVRESLATDAPHASVLIAPSWSANWTTRTTDGGATTVAGTTALPLPYVFNNRLMQPYWLRLNRTGDVFTGSISPDGVTWTALGSSTIPMAANVFVGLSACSRLTTVTTTAAFDNVSVPDSVPPPPAAPGHLMAAVIENRIALSWNASAGATTYSLQRATTTSGPYSVIATTTLATTFTDATPVVGQPYYYVVTAVSAAGASPASNEATATVPFPPPPVITSATSANGTVGATFAYTIVATNQPTGFTATGLPASLTLNPLTGAISGMLNEVGVFSVALTATNSGGTGNAILTLSTRPAISSAPLASTYAGSPLNYTIVATNQPATYGATGLPAGLVLNSSTGVISGTPTATGSFPVSLSATNIAGTGTAALTITVVAPPGPTAPWVDLDIGNAAGGITSFANGAFTIRAAGNNVGGTADNYHHLHRPVTGNFSLVARVSATTFAGTNDQVGIGLRASPAQGSVSAVVMLDHGVDRVYLNTRGTTNAAATQSNTNSGTGLGAPLWLRLTRVGNVFSGYYSTNGETWTQIAANTTLNNMPATASLGPVIASRRVNILNATTYDHVTIAAAAPVVSPATAVGTVGSPFQFAVTASNTPYLYKATGLPPGLTIDPDTGVIAGTPAVAGSFTVALTAINGFGTGAGGGTGTGTLNLNLQPGSASIAFDNLAPTYSGAAQPVSVTTSPAGLAVAITYNGEASAPVNAGSYGVVATVTSPNWIGSASGTLTILPASAAVNLTALTHTYDGGAHAVAVTTNPAGLAHEVTYAGSSTPPVNAGSYATVVTITDPNHTGSVTGTMTIQKAAAMISLGNLAATYNGSSHAVTAATNPADLAVHISYAGTGDTTYGPSTTAPTNAGSYSVAATIIEANYTGSAGGTLTITQSSATVTLSGLRQLYDGTPRPVTATTNPAGLVVDITYDGEGEAPVYPGTYAVAAEIADTNHEGSAIGTLVIGTTALVRHAPTLNADVDGSVQMLLPENVTFNSNAAIYSDLLAPGTPTVRLNGSPVFIGTKDAGGTASPSNYTVTLNGGSLLRYLVRQIDPLPMPAVTAPPQPAGTRNVSINNASQSPGDFATLRNLTLNSNAGTVVVPPGTYGNFTANSGGTFVLGVAGSTEPTVYNFQSLTLNSNSSVQVVGPVIVTLNTALSVNGSGLGASAHPEWLTLRIASGGLTLNSNLTVYGYVTAPSGTVTLNGSSKLVGGVIADRLTLNGNAMVSDPVAH